MSEPKSAATDEYRHDTQERLRACLLAIMDAGEQRGIAGRAICGVAISAVLAAAARMAGCTGTSRKVFLELAAIAWDVERGAAAVAPEIPAAAALGVSICDTCESVHVNLLDRADLVFATAAVPVTAIDTFVADLQRNKQRLLRRHPAPAMQQ
jgi:hypothetical protein